MWDDFTGWMDDAGDSISGWFGGNTLSDADYASLTSDPSQGELDSWYSGMFSMPDWYNQAPEYEAPDAYSPYLSDEQYNQFTAQPTEQELIDYISGNAQFGDRPIDENDISYLQQLKEAYGYVEPGVYDAGDTRLVPDDYGDRQWAIQRDFINGVIDPARYIELMNAAAKAGHLGPVSG